MTTEPDAQANERAMYSVFEHDPDLADIVTLFVQEMPERIEELRAAADAGDVDAAVRLAHQLKGAAGGYGFEPLGEVAARVEHALQQAAADGSPDAELVRGLARPLIEACGRVRLAGVRTAA